MMDSNIDLVLILMKLPQTNKKHIAMNTKKIQKDVEYLEGKHVSLYTEYMYNYGL